MTAIHLAGPVLAGDDDVRAQAWIVGGRITYERPACVDATLDGWVIPGLVDMHCHLAIGPAGPVDLDLARKIAQTERDAGVLLVRDVGSPVDIAALDGEPGLPRIVRSGRFIARPKRYLPGYAVEVEPGQLAAETARQAGLGTGWVKLIADWIDRDMGADADLTPLWAGPELAAAVAAAHASGVRVTAHTFATESLDDLLDAGIDCIEHGTGMTDDHAARAAADGIAVVPTLRQVANFESFAAQGEAKFPRFAARMRRMHERRYEHVARLHEAGVTLLLGSDAGTSIGHGEPALEAREMAKAMPAADVVAGATWRARRFLGAPVLEEGEPADLVVLPGDPRADIGHLAAPLAVLLEGTHYS
jgi:imidazolonepropionase-like amidohydrolase